MEVRNLANTLAGPIGRRVIGLSTEIAYLGLDGQIAHQIWWC